MPIKPFTRIPQDIIEWSRYLASVSVTPSDGTVTHEMLEDSAALSVLGTASAAGPVGDISASANGQYLGRRADAVGFFALQDSDIPAEIARDTEVTAAISAHEAAGDPHPGYVTTAVLSDAASDAQFVLAGRIFGG